MSAATESIDEKLETSIGLIPNYSGFTRSVVALLERSDGPSEIVGYLARLVRDVGTRLRALQDKREDKDAVEKLLHFQLFAKLKLLAYCVSKLPEPMRERIANQSGVNLWDQLKRRRK